MLYYADMIHYALSGAPITGAIYRKRQLGPTSDALLPTLRELERSNAIRVLEVDYFGFRKKEYEVRDPPDIGRLGASEVALIDDVIDFVCRQNTAKTISEFSHGIPWEVAEYGDVLPYHGAIHLFPNQVSLEALDWAADEVGAIDIQRSKQELRGLPGFLRFSKAHFTGGPRTMTGCGTSSSPLTT